jgi:hypothetical protein
MANQFTISIFSSIVTLIIYYVFTLKPGETGHCIIRNDNGNMREKIETGLDSFGRYKVVWSKGHYNITAS